MDIIKEGMFDNEKERAMKTISKEEKKNKRDG